VFPMATPLALKLGPGLQPDADAGRESLRRDLDELRAHVEHDTGICLPGVRVLEAKGRGDYAILIDDTVVASGSVRLDQLNQDPPLVLVLRHLEAAVRRGLPSFIGVDDVQAWLDDAPREVSALARVALPDRSARVLLSRVLQVLALEGVPLTSPAVVLKQLQRAAPSAGVLGIGAAVRRQMRPSLPGNAPGTRRVNVPLPVEEALAAGLHATDGPVSWQLPRRETEPLLNRLREIGQDAQAGTPGALVVRSSVLRPFVWRLIVAEFPGLSVLSEEELIEREAKPAAAAVMA
jgi:flagellar biosynthesis component FlhA